MCCQHPPQCFRSKVGGEPQLFSWIGAFQQVLPAVTTSAIEQLPSIPWCSCTSCTLAATSSFFSFVCSLPIVLRGLLINSHAPNTKQKLHLLYFHTLCRTEPFSRYTHTHTTRPGPKRTAWGEKGTERSTDKGKSHQETTSVEKKINSDAKNAPVKCGNCFRKHRIVGD